MAAIFQEHPFNKGVHALNARRIQHAFPLLTEETAKEHLSLVQFLDAEPQRLHSKGACDAYLRFLETSFQHNPKHLIEAMREHASALDLAFRTLTAANALPVHDTYVPEGELDRIQWIENTIDQQLLRLWEASLHGFLLIHCHIKRRSTGGGLDSMDIYNTVEATNNTPLALAQAVYAHTIRNGIGHGKVRFTNDHVSYTDKKGNRVQRTIKEVTRLFDDLIDVLNGFALAYQLFWAQHRHALLIAGLEMPKSVLFEELKARVNMPGWKILACLESERRAPKRQLEIHLHNSHWDFHKVQYWGFYTAYWAERLTGSFESIFLHFRSSSSNAISWAGYNAERMRQLRLAGTKDIAPYKGVIEGDLMFFVPYIKLPNWLNKVGTYAMAFRSQFRTWQANRRTDNAPLFLVRHCKIHAKRRYSILEDPAVVLHLPDPNASQDFIRKHHHTIARAAVKASRRSLPRYAVARYLPVRYARIMLYTTDKRRRQLDNAGLPPDLIGTIGFNTTGHIKNIEIATGTLELQGRYRLVWNSRWLNAHATAPVPTTPSIIPVDRT